MKNTIIKKYKKLIKTLNVNVKHFNETQILIEEALEYKQVLKNRLHKVHNMIYEKNNTKTESNKVLDYYIQYFTYTKNEVERLFILSKMLKLRIKNIKSTLSNLCNE